MGDPISTIAGLVSTVISRVWPDKTEQQKEIFTLELTKELNESQLLQKQIDVNDSEAQNPNLWVSGARPFIMWVCGCSFAWQFLIQPIITYIYVMTGHPVPILPVFDYASLNTVLMGMLGLSAMRSYEKVQGVNNRHG